jgi:hypothetical protein
MKSSELNMNDTVEYGEFQGLQSFLGSEDSETRRVNVYSQEMGVRV